MTKRRVDRLMFACVVALLSLLIGRNLVRLRQEHALESAVARGDEVTAHALLDQGVCVGRQRQLNKLLIMATNSNQASLACALLQKGADPNCGSPYGRNMPLLNAAIRAPAAVPCLLGRGAQINARNAAGATALMLAVTAHHIDATRILLDRKADVNALSQIGTTALYLATQQGDPAMIDLLLVHGASLNIGLYQHGSLNLPLNAAVETGRLDLLRALLVGSEANAREATAATKGQALSQAVEQGQEDMVRLLLEHGARPNPRSVIFWLALQVSGEHKGKQILQLLHRFGVSLTPNRAEVNIRNDRMETPLLLALANGNDTRAQQFVAAGASVNAGDSFNRTPLMIAIDHCHTMISELLQRGANPNIITTSGMTPLNQAVLAGDLELTRMLLAHGADANLKLPRGHTALYLARKHGRPDIATLLEQASGN